MIDPVLSQPLGRSVLRRALWSVYAIPTTMLMLAASFSAVAGGGTLAVVDAVVSLPQFVVLQLHIWDKRVPNAVIWKVYAFAFLAWQLAYGLFIQPSVSGKGFEPGLLVGLAIQTPMLVALFLYAFRTWPDQEGKGIAPETRRKAGLLAFGMATGLLGLILVVPPALSQFRSTASASLSSAMYRPKIHEVTIKPPATPSSVVQKSLTVDERKHLRALLERGDFDALDRSFAELETEFRQDPSNDHRVYEAYQLFSLPEHEERLDEWVSHDRSKATAYLVRADNRYSAGWRARGTRYASETSASRFRKMDRYFAKAMTDVDEALDKDPGLMYAYLIRLGIHNAKGEDAEERETFEEARRRFPHSYIVYGSMVLWARPRWGGSYEEMESVARSAIQANPQDERFYALLGNVYADQADGFEANHRDDEAMRLYTKALSYGRTSGFLVERGRVYSRQGRLDAALADADRSIELDPGYIEAHLFRATVLHKKGDRLGAERQVARARSISPGDPAIERWRAWAGERERRSRR